MLESTLPHDQRNFFHSGVKQKIHEASGHRLFGNHPHHRGGGFVPGPGPGPGPGTQITADSTGSCPAGMTNTTGLPGGLCSFVTANVGPTTCVWPMRLDPVTNTCKIFVGEQPGPEGGGVAVMGQYGAAMMPDVTQVQTLDCLPGMILGKDNLCYNTRDLTNKERKWPRGRRPLLTGGDRNAITRAARAAKAIQRTEKQLQKMGMLKSPTRRKAPAPRPRQIGPGGPSIINVE